MSSYAVIIPVNIKGASKWAHLRVSVVDQDVPLLISKTALKELGVVLDLARGCVCFGRLNIDVHLRETTTGLCGFDINLDASRRRCECPSTKFLDEECEVVLSEFDQHSYDEVWASPEDDMHKEMRVRATKQAIQECESRAKQLLRDKDVSFPSLLDLVRRLPFARRHRHRQINDGPGMSNLAWTAGLFVHGNVIGITRRTTQYPNVVKYINMFMRQRSDQQWTSFALQRNVCTGVHKDVHNQKNSESITMTFGSFSQGQLWVARDEKQSTHDAVWKEDERGNQMPGDLIDTFEKPYAFDPHTPHSTCPWEGERWCLTMYRVRHADQVGHDVWHALSKLRFPLGRRTASRTFGIENRCAHGALLSSCHREPQERRDDRHHEETPQLEGDLSSISRHGQVAHSVVEDDASSGCTKEEGRVRSGDCVLEPSSQGGTGEAHCGSAPRVVCSVEAEEENIGSPRQLEEVGLGESQGAVCFQGVPGSRTPPGCTLVEMDPFPADLGGGTVASGCPGQPGTPARRHVALPEVLGVRHSNDCPDESCNERRVLGLPAIPLLQGNPPHGVPREASDGGHPGTPDGDEAQGNCQGSEVPDRQQGQVREGREARIAGESSQVTGRLRDGVKWTRNVVRQFMGGNRRHTSGGSIVGRRARPDAEVQRESHPGGDRSDCPNETQQGPGEREARHTQGVRSPETADHKEPAAETVDSSDRVPLERDEIEARIRDGRARRSRLKQGTVKRLLGNTRTLLGAVFISTVAAAGAAMQAVPFAHRKRPDVLEISDGCAQVSSTLSRWGFSMHQPIDIHGDLSDEEGRTEVIKWIDRTQPRLVVMSNCCPGRPPTYAVHRNQTQAQRRERRWRERQKQVVDFVQQVFDCQLKRGDHAMADLPVGEHWGVAALADNMIRHPNVRCVHGWNVGFKTGQESAWVTTCHHVAEELERSVPSKPVQNDPNDQSTRLEARRRNFSRAVCVGFIRCLKDTDPGRLRRMLRSLAARIRSRIHAGDRSVQDLRWSEKAILRSLKQWSAVYAQEGVEGSESEGEDVDMPHTSEEPNPRSLGHPGDAAVERPGPPRESVRSGLSSDGITFEVPSGRHLEDSVKQGLIRAHCNLGHPSPADLQRFLKLGGAKQHVVEAVSWMRCVTCAHSKRPSTHRTCSIPPSQITFGDEVQLDCICVHDADKVQHWFLSILDRATSYHLIELMRDHSPVELHRAFDRGWCKWAGPPLRASVDMEGGFQGHEFWHEVGKAGTSLSAIGGTAHWQQGKIERHNQTIKDMLHKTIRHTQPKGREEMRKLAREVAWAKNSLVREHGWSPVSLVFGREPRVYGELHQGGNPVSYHPSVGDPDSDVASRMRFRYHAKMEFIKSQARQMILRTAHNRTRRLPIPKVGQLVFFWRAENHKKRDSQSKWVGPGYVVGIQDRNAWVACGGRCFLVAGEHLREAIGDERHYGDPELQKALALFKKIPSEATYEDLIGQADPIEEPAAVEQEPLVQDVAEDMDVDPLVNTDLPEEYAKLRSSIGWHIDSQSNPVLVSHKAWAYRSPESRYPAQRFPWRTSWGFVGGEWKCLESEVKWMELEDHHQFIPGGPASILITIFQSRTRKDACLDDVPVSVKRRKAQPDPHPVNAVQHSGNQTQSKTKLKRMMEKEIPFDMIPSSERELYRAAEEKEWQSWVDYNSCEVLSLEESRQIEQERPDRVLPSRYVFRNKNAGLKDANGDPLPVKAKARLCLQGHLCPDSKSGQVQVDSPTIERVSTMIFLHLVTSYGWTQNWFIGDISNAFLQGAPLQGKPEMFMRQPKQGLKGLQPGQILKLLKPVYGRPDAPRAWYNELSRILEAELGFTKSQVDPALFCLRDSAGTLKALMVVHVDDVMICHDGSVWGQQTAQKLHDRFPFGTWLEVAKEQSGVSYCGKEIKVCQRDGEQCYLFTKRFPGRQTSANGDRSHKIFRS